MRATLLFSISLILGQALFPGPTLADKLVLMSPHPDETQNEFESAFRVFYKSQTGREIDLEWLDIGGGTSSILRYIKSEYDRVPSGIGIDVFFGGGMDPYIELSHLGLCEPYRLPQKILDRIPAEIGGVPLYDPNFQWYGATLAGFGIVYNTRVLDILKFPVPKTWADLGEPRYFSWVGSGDPRKSGSVHMAYELILQAYGWDRGWEVITTMGANIRNFGASGSAAPKEVAVGEVACGLSIDFYAWMQAEQVGQGYIGFVMPDNLTIVNPDGLAILKGAPNITAAKLFVDFVMSDAGQKLWFLRKGIPGGPTQSQLNRFTVLPDLYDTYKEEAAISLNPFNWKSDLTYDADLGGGRWSVVNDLIGVLVIDSHEALQQVWQSEIKKGLTDTRRAQLSAMPVTAEEAQELGKSWRDPEIRNRTMAAWTTFARGKYGDYQPPLLTLIVDWLTLIFPCGIVLLAVFYLWRMRTT
ncbi:MAG: ABC transporter substrate-binding protein [bacterium]|nr:ABC transporter substrate-binding protein [bacterium]